jgi:hypothetical protein
MYIMLEGIGLGAVVFRFSIKTSDLFNLQTAISCEPRETGTRFLQL